jgi:predicted nucleic acid-binding protein
VVEEAGSDRARRLSRVRLEAPDLLLAECANILWKKTRLDDLSRRDASEGLALLLRAPVTLADSRGLVDPALQLSFELNHPAYDCLYLALAVRRGIPLVTADERLVSAARRQRKRAHSVMLLKDLPD